ncbi:1-aminocyclopropane-1-carboxylate deaminase/D-cysteine desulfhydrase [Sphingobacterium sp. LRF_L2]|uniref:1-aminocyclopropane-1-carboxylate deaminase/D-cysteine desulfhydrase n=1 Tax=Sphingobacterium sp. LRF_L2 TaxID=3369421 RepID=UPI003F5D945B
MFKFDFYSPEEEIILPLYQEKQVRVFVKRDDLIHPYISGNKWRKLKYTLEEAKKQGKKLLITFGGAFSNHLLATACTGAKFGFTTHAFVRGEEVENPVLQLCKLFGMQLQFTDRQAYRDKQALFQKHFGQVPEAYFIDEGGAGTTALRGCSELVAELQQSYDHMFCACGTGTTAAGIWEGIQQYSPTTQLQAVPVLKGGQFVRDEMESLGIKQVDQIKFHYDYHFGGYAKTTAELITFIQSYTQATGILIEPIYTGKLFFALHDQLEKNQIAAGSKILVIHTGGLTGLLGMLHKF